jgi:hypothetical protein
MEDYNYTRIGEVTRELQAAKDLVKALEQEFKDLINPPAPSAMEQVEQALGFTSTTSRIIDLLNSQPMESFSFQDVFTKVGGNEPYVRSLLSRLAREGKIEKRDWHNYGAAKAGNKERPKAKFSL